LGWAVWLSGGGGGGGGRQEEGPMETGATLPANDLCQQREKAAEKCLCTWRCECECEYLCAMDDVGAMTEISKWKPHIAHTVAGEIIGTTANRSKNLYPRVIILERV